MEMKKKIDLHIHTIFSDSSCLPQIKPKDLAKIYRSGGLQGAAVCDHDVCEPYLKMKKELSKTCPDFILIPGIEISSSKGHILGLGLTETIKKGLSPQETVDEIRKHGGISIIAHPFSPTGIGHRIFKLKKFDAFEEINGLSFDILDIYTKYALRNIRRARTAGSDAHTAKMLGKTYTLFPKNCDSVEDVYKYIKKKKTIPHGEHRTIFSFIWDWGSFRFSTLNLKLKYIKKHGLRRSFGT
jgi:predicted metal-dependent phosphoesterase TrpH